MKFVCPVCGYVYEGDSVPEGFKCPLCGADGSKFIKQEEGMTWASEHVVGVAKDVDPEILQGLRDNFAGESRTQRGLSRDRSLLGEGSLRRG